MGVLHLSRRRRHGRGRRQCLLNRGLQGSCGGLVVVAATGGCRRLGVVRSGRGSAHSGALVAANFGLVLPVALIEDLDLVLQEDQYRWLTNPGKFVLELIQEAFVKLPIKCTVIPTSPQSVAVEIKGVLDSLT